MQIHNYFDRSGFMLFTCYFHFGFCKHKPVCRRQILVKQGQLAQTYLLLILFMPGGKKGLGISGFNLKDTSINLPSAIRPIQDLIQGCPNNIANSKSHRWLQHTIKLTCKMTPETVCYKNTIPIISCMYRTLLIVQGEVCTDHGLK